MDAPIRGTAAGWSGVLITAPFAVHTQMILVWTHVLYHTNEAKRAGPGPR